MKTITKLALVFTALMIPASCAMAEERATLSGLEMVDVARSAELDFDASVTEYDLTVAEDNYAVKFTPIIEGEGTIKVTAKGLDALLTIVDESNTDSENPDEVGQESLEIAAGQAFYVTMTQKRLAAISENDVNLGRCAEGLEVDQDYIVTLETAGQTYTINLHRPNSAQWAEQFVRYQWELADGKQQDYWLYVPEDYDAEDAQKALPVVLILHGAGQRLSDSSDVLYRYMMATTFVKYGKEVIVIAPQCNNTDHDASVFGWADRDLAYSEFGEGAFAILQDVIANYNVDEKRIYVGGCSMGGNGTLAMLYNHPEVFAAAIIDCAYHGGEEVAASFAEKIKDQDIDLYIVHAEHDPQVAYENTVFLRAALDAADVPYEAMIFSADEFFRPDAHFTWTPFFDHEENIDWLLAQVKND